MTKLKINPKNAQYYTEEFKRGFECGVERQYEHTVSVLQDIKEEIREMNFDSRYKGSGLAIKDACNIIDKHISGKEKE